MKPRATDDSCIPSEEIHGTHYEREKAEEVEPTDKKPPQYDPERLVRTMPNTYMYLEHYLMLVPNIYVFGTVVKNKHVFGVIFINCLTVFKSYVF